MPRPSGDRHPPESRVELSAWFGIADSNLVAESFDRVGRPILLVVTIVAPPQNSSLNCQRHRADEGWSVAWQRELNRMRSLAIETSTRHGSVALLEQHNVVREVGLPLETRTAQSLAPAINKLLDQAGWKPRSIQLVGVSNGPGSFTGLRIAVTAAKFFAYAAHADLVAINTLRVIVEQLPGDVTDACALIDAQRRQLFAARYRRDRSGFWQVDQDCRIVEGDLLAPMLAPETVLTGPALGRLTVPDLADQPRAEPDCWAPRAGVLGQLAYHAHRAGQRDDHYSLLPHYYRSSYADEK